MLRLSELDDGWRNSTFPKLHRESLRKGMEHRDYQKGPMDFLLQVSPDWDGPTMVAMIGPRGTGKTLAATLVARRWHYKGLSTRYTTAYEIFARLKETFGDNGQGDYRQAWRSLVNCPLLVIDEIQVRSGTPWEDNTLTELIDARYREMRTTIMISNLEHQEFKKHVGPSIYDRLRECGAVLVFDGPSFRSKQGK